MMFLAMQHPLKSYAVFLCTMLFKYLVDVGGAFSYGRCQDEAQGRD